MFEMEILGIKISIEVIIIGIFAVCFILCFLFTKGINVLSKKITEKNKPKLLLSEEVYKSYCDELSKQVDDLCLCSQSGFEEKSHNDSIIKFKVGKTQDNELVCHRIKEVKKYTGNEYGIFTPNIPGSLEILDRIPIDEIMFFKETGSLQYTTSVSGGGVNVSGAITGGLIAGDVGAIIGSRQEVTSKTETHDDRTVVLKLTNGKEKIYDYRYYRCFMELIPEKEYSFLMMKKMGM